METAGGQGRKIPAACGGVRRDMSEKRTEVQRDASPLEIYRVWNSRLLAGDVEGAARLIDSDRWSEKCLGLTDWLTDFQVAVTHYVKNMVKPWRDLEMHEEDVVEGRDAVTIRFRVDATHVGEFLGVPATGRRISFQAIRIVKIREGRVTGQWAQLDLWGIHGQLTSGS